MTNLLTNFFFFFVNPLVSPPPDFRVGASLTAVNDELFRYAGQQASPTGNQIAGINNLLYSLVSFSDNE